jgi:hypothetical protein
MRPAQIYVRPAGVHALTLIDDLTAETVQSMAGEGFEPAVIVETSRGNYQVWLKHAEVLDERSSTAAAKLLAARLAGDPSSADWRHFGRLAGFTNQKLQRRLPSGLAPFVRLRKSSGEIFSRAQETAREVRRTLAEASRAPGLTSGQHSDGASSLRPIAEFHRDPVYGGDLHRGGENAVAVINVSSGKVLGRIPTGWYPSSVTVSADGTRLFVVNMKAIQDPMLHSEGMSRACRRRRIQPIPTGTSSPCRRPAC